MRHEDAISILDLVDSGVIMLNDHGKITFWNQFISDTSQITLSAIENKHWLDVFPMLHGSRVEKAIDKALDLNFPSILSYKLLKAHFPLYKKSLATKPPYHIKQSIIVKPLLEEGKNKGCIIYINDVSAVSKRETDLNNQSIELRNTIRSYAEVKSQFEQVFEDAHNGIIVFDIKGKIINVNQATCILYQKEKQAFTNLDIDEVLPSIKEYFYDQQQQRYIYKENAKHEFFQELNISANKFLSISLSQIGESASDDHFFVFITDITEIKDVEQELLRANSELEEFAYRTSHDLRSPIVSSIALINMARESIDTQEPEKIEHCLSLADKSLTKLEVLIKDILTLTETKNKEETFQSIDVQTAIEGAFEGMTQLQGFDKITKQLEVQQGHEIWVKRSRFTMILENLISNAVKYHDPSENAPYIKISTEWEGPNFILDISDNGLGIPENQHQKLFKMFNRFHPKTAFGSGLGLYLMKKSAQVLGGDIEFIPQQKGAGFRLTIPQNQQLH